MIHPVPGLHHVTATVGDAQSDLDFCLGLLGMRSVKKTVNFDNHDVYHFNAISFREPGGVLFEVATVQPGFTADEDLSALGRGLKLPPLEERHRTAIEANLPAVECR